MKDMERQRICFRRHTDAVAYLKNQSDRSTTKAVQRELFRISVIRSTLKTEKDTLYKKFFWILSKNY